MAKIAVDHQQAGARPAVGGSATSEPVHRVLARGAEWSVRDIICSSGPQDHPFEEQHSQVSIAIVVAGTFQYRTGNGSGRVGELMTPGSLLLGNAGQYFECGHEHGTGDRCISFHFAPEYFQRIAADAGVGRGEREFRTLRLPALRKLSPLIARACAEFRNSGGADNLTSGILWEELGIQLAASAVRISNGSERNEGSALPSVTARVTRAVRMIEKQYQSELTVRRLAREAGLSPYHFLRTFEQLTDMTPHQYLRRTRLRQAAIRLSTERAKVLDIALDCGFGDMSNFDRAFRNEFGLSPRQFRRQQLQ